MSGPKQENNAIFKPLLGGNTATGYLKLIGLLFMFIDHAGKALCGNLHEMRILGRIAFPVYVWCAIVGFCYTRDIRKYLLRLLILFLVSQPFYVLALTHDWLLPNICLTLLLGLGALWGIREKWYGSQVWAPVAALCLATILHADGGWKGVLLMLLIYAVRESRAGIAAVMIAFCLFWGSSYEVTGSLFGIPIPYDQLPEFLAGPMQAFFRGQAWCLLALPFLLIRWPKKDVKLPKWLGYALYPAHLALIALLERLTV